MKKRLVSIIIISVVSSITAILISQAVKIIMSKPAQPAPKVIVKVKNDTVYVPKKDTTHHSTLVQPQDEGAYWTKAAQTYLNNGKPHHLDSVDFYTNQLKKLYAVKGLSPESNAVLKKLLDELHDKTNELKKQHKVGNDQHSRKDSDQRANKDSLIY